MNIFSFFGNLAFYLGKYFPEELDPSLKPIDSAGCIPCRDIVFDFIIVGAGSAGCVVANRLSENPNWKVLLIEAGGDEDYITDVPALAPYMVISKYDWYYKTVRQRRGCQFVGGYCIYTRGRVMGGSSTVNGMLYVRGHRDDFDDWEAMGNPGWSYKDVLPYFLKLENMTIPGLADSPYHSTEGPQYVGFSRYNLKISEDLILAGEQFGLQRLDDYNGVSDVGIARSQSTIKGGTRCSTSKAYLDPIRNRSNLIIFKNTLVTKVLFNKNIKKAIGVSCITDGKEYNVMASKEVILSAGAINTPKLLMLSGVGPKKDLNHLGIPVYNDLPVGQYLVEHPCVIMLYHLNKQMTYNEPLFNEDSLLQYTKNQSGPLSMPPHSVVAFFNDNLSSLKAPELEFFFGVAKVPLLTTEIPVGYVYVTKLKPKSLGSVQLGSKHFKDNPLIDLNLIGHDDDLVDLRRGIKRVIKLMQSPLLKKYSPYWMNEFAPICFKFPYLSNDFLDCYINYFGLPNFHPAGTARMGSVYDETTVVDPTLKVHNIDGLRVIDASVIPSITRGNINGPVIMIGEKGADIIKSYYSS